MKTYSRFILRHKFFTLFLIALATAWFGYRATSIQVDTDVLNFFPEDDPDVRFFKETGGKFGSNYINFVALESKDIFTFESLSKVRKITKAVTKVNGVKQVLSITNILDTSQLRDGISVTHLVPAEIIPKDKSRLEKLRKKALGNNMLVGNIISANGKAALISVRIEENADKENVAREIKKAAAKGGPGANLYFGGFSMVMEYMSSLIARDMSKLIPITFLIVILMLYISFGRLIGVVLPLATVGLAIIWTIGAMSIMGLALTMLTSVIPVVVIAICTSMGVYVLGKYYETRSELVKNPYDGRPMEAMISPMMISGIAMAAGFLSLIVAPLTIFKEFGKACAISAFFSVILSITFIPVVLSLVKYSRARPFALISDKNIWMGTLLQNISRVINAGPKSVFVIFGAMLLASFYFYSKVPRDVNLLDYFPKASEPQVSEKLLQKHFGGSQLFIINFRSKDIRHPGILEQMELLGKGLRVIEKVNLPQSVADIISVLNSQLTGEPGLPDTVGKVSQIMMLLDGQEALKLLVESNFTNGVVQARIGDIDSAVVRKALENVREVMEESIETELVTLSGTSLPKEQRMLFNRELAKKITKKVSLDYAFYTNSTPGKYPALVTNLEKIINTDEKLEKDDFGPVEKLLNDFLASDEADILISDPEVISNISNTLAINGSLSQKSLEQTLKGIIPENIRADDPEGIVYLARNIKILIKQYLARKHHVKAQAAIFDELKFDSGDKKNIHLAKDLKAAAWGVNSENLFVSPKSYKAITGHKAKRDMITSFEARLTGWPPLNSKFDAMLVHTQIKAILIAIFAIIIVLSLHFRSITGGVVTTIPAMFTVLVYFGVLGALRIPLDNTTFMISSIALGIGTGYSVNFMSRLVEEYGNGVKIDKAVSVSLITSGRSVLISALAVSLGFAVLVFSVMTPQKRFGMMIALTMMLSACGSFTLLPAIILQFKPRFLSKYSKKLL